MNKNLQELYKYGNMVIPLYFLQNYKEFNIELSEFVFLMYLYNKGDLITFNPSKFADEIGLSVKEIMSSISILCDKHLIEVKVIKSEKDITEEVISLELFFDKLSLIIIDNFSNKNVEKTDCFDYIQKEFGRNFSPVEIEIVRGWVDSGYNDELIKEAIREAVFNGVKSLRYIDTILNEWEKKGYKSREDVEKNKKVTRKIEDDEKVEEIFDYNWFEDDD